MIALHLFAGLSPLLTLLAFFCCTLQVESEQVASFKSVTIHFDLLFSPADSGLTTGRDLISSPRHSPSKSVMPANSVRGISSSGHMKPLIIRDLTCMITMGYVTVEQSDKPRQLTENHKDLVWSGWGNSGPGNAHGLHVCRYEGADHLCFFQGSQQKGYCRGHGVIMDKQYRIVRSVQPGGGMASSDMHEFKLINDGKSALMTVYQQRQFDMSPWNVKMGVGWVMESVFQEVDVETGRVLFEWRSLDHVDPSLSYTYPDHTDTSGTGLDPFAPWDYFHINSIDKNKDGDYLISSRHTSAVYKISGKDGSIIWRLHGQEPSFTNVDFSFSQQHDARWQFENSTHTLLSLYNNGYNGYNQTHKYSSGMVILIDHVAKTARQTRDYLPPGKGMLSSSQGNMQVLPNHHIMMGWGNNAYVSEHDIHGNLVFWGYFTKDSGFMNYRAQKFEWDGNPTDVPALWTYSKSPVPSSPTTFYVSWNGATRVKSWRFYGAQNATGPFVLLDEIAKSGFETSYTNVSFSPWTYAEAVDARGELLGKTANTYTFVPSPELQAYCGDESCDNAGSYGRPGDIETRPTVPPMGVNTVPWIDPHDPEKLLDWGQSGSQYAQQSASGSVYDFAIGAGVVLLGTISLSLIVRVCRKGRRRRLSSKDDDDDMAEEPKRTQGQPRPWWNLRRYTEENYLLLTASPNST